MNRFDYVPYDQVAQEKGEALKALFKQVEEVCEKELPNGRSKSLVMTHLEEAYMWVGKAIRDDHVLRNGESELQK